MSPRRIPTKGELLRLQKLYRTDKKMAEVLGGEVTEQLVAYWRRKKGIARYSFPKFSEKDIQDAWDRFGDDFHAGLELGLSKAAFYNWRRRYKIIRKPAALKLEQLSLELFTDEKSDHKRQGNGHQTMIQKVLAHHLEQKETAVGQTYEIEPDIAFGLGRVGDILTRFQELETTYVKNPARIIISLDGADADGGSHPAAMFKAVRTFVRLQQIKAFFDTGEGDGLQAAMERGMILPGQMIVSNRPEVTACGALGAVSLPMAPETMAGVWAEGKSPVTVPETVRLLVTGRLPRGVFARDVGHHIAALMTRAECRGRMIEFYGAAIDQMSIPERFTLCCLALHTGAIGAVCPFDATTRRYISPRARRPFTPVPADRNAAYASEFTFDVNTMKPAAAVLSGEWKMTPVEELAGVSIQQIFLGGLTGGHFDDLKIAADIIKGKKINPDTRLFIQPSSRSVYLEMLKKGLARSFTEAGATILNPGGFSAAGRNPMLSAGERGLTTYFDTEVSVCDGELYHVSPATAAASALTGQITNPAGYIKM